MPEELTTKISPQAALRVTSARSPASLPLAQKEPLIVLGAKRQPEIISPPVMPTASTCFGPRGAALFSREGPLWICDTGHHRLLGFAALPESDEAGADWVIGQKDFFSEGRNGKYADGAGAATLNVPTGICFTEKGLVVADAWNHRVLIWHSRPQASNVPADVVLGQKDFCSTEANHGLDHPSAATLHWPYGVHYHQGKLFVADSGNRRVLIWNNLPEANGQSADCVLGQIDFNCRDENAGHDPSAMSMRWPHDLTFWRGKLCVADAGNNRVLVWNDCPQVCGAAADQLLGQSSAEAVDFNQALYWPRCNTLNMPYGISALGDWLIIADTANSRLLGWHTDEPAATALFGQRDFHEKGDNRWQPAVADSLCWPYGVQVCSDLLVVADSGNNRVSVWEAAL